ncbi:MAG: rRNA pseudouridine synthase [Lachnospiraceae bacterium]|nr:rRNA pseudouridine synthase [Lachnospiraceae bacterium]
MGSNIRLDKILSNLGYGTRSEIKKAVKKGAVTVNGIVVKSPEQKVSSDDVIAYEGRIIDSREHVYYMLNKPSGCITAKEEGCDTVFGYIDDGRKGLFAVGRLDKDTEGLLLITDDGEFDHRLMSPAHHVEKEYEAVIDAPIDENLIELFSEGVDIGDEKLTKPAKLVILENANERCLIRLYITERRYHQVKRMFEAFSRKVVALKRIRIGALALDESLKPGEYRELTDEEIELLMKG